MTHETFPSEDSYPSDQELADWLAGERVASVVAWAAADPRRADWLVEFERVARAARPARVGNVNQSLGRLRAQLAAMPKASGRDAKAKRVRNTEAQKLWLRAYPLRLGSYFLRRSVLVGALAVLSLTIGIATWYRTDSDWRIRSTSKSYVTHHGEQATIHLADGSSLVLAPDTRMRYTVDNSGGRVVDLIGEAFFTVSPRVNQPFVVRTGAVTTRVLGTTFDVRRYPADISTQITVVSGRVVTGTYPTPTVLEAGAIAQVTDSNVVVRTATDPVQAVSWVEGRLVFNDTPVPVVLAALKRWYGYEFRVTDTVLATQSISAEFRTDRVAETLNTLKAVLGATMTFDGNVVSLQLKSSGHGASNLKPTHNLISPSEPEVGK